ncbi:hypothetical protein HET69_42475 [Streptomyces sp. CJ_13]|uniref:hypothetical protein n=1 Tax=Streptomyces sp. CJ_13 TaxID=2724943 RepID=UPI001BDD86E0|nr:hypothetical protein [Streptomyces sp. CJ_13]MBT1190455.1 hypothetical protein [Streptomyces sp. CJ_13]
MPQMSKVELYAAIRRDHRGGMSMRELERKHGVTWRTVRKALDSSWPELRRPPECGHGGSCCECEFTFSLVLLFELGG